MSHNHRRQSEAGQTAILFALMLIGLVLFTGLAIDGGNVLNVRRITQNAADASALGAVRYMSTADGPTEQALLSGINKVVEANGIPDTDGVPGNESNTNIVAHYTDDRGNRLVSPNCNLVGSCGGSVPQPAFGIEVEVTNPIDTYFMGLIGRQTVDVGADAVAVARGFADSGLSENVMVALGSCSTEDRQLTGRGDDNEFLGGLYSNSFFDTTGDSNHYHGQVTYVEGFNRAGTGDTVFEPGEPVVGETIIDPFAGWSYLDFGPGSAIATAHAGSYFDVSTLDNPSAGQPGVVEMSEIINRSVNPNNYPELYNPDDRNPITASDGVVLNPNQMRTGIYYAGDKEIRIGEEVHGPSTRPGTNGTVTIVSGNRIKTTEKSMNLSAYMNQDSAFPGLLFFSDYALPGDPCQFQTEIDAVINMAGNENGLRFDVHHHPDDLPRDADPNDYIDCPYPRVDGCYVASSSIFTGLIYAPNGRVDTSDQFTTYIGAIVAYTIDYSGHDNLFVTNPALFPTSDPRIYLER